MADTIPGKTNHGLSALTGASDDPRPVRSGWLLLGPFTTARSIPQAQGRRYGMMRVS